MLPIVSPISYYEKQIPQEEGVTPVSRISEVIRVGEHPPQRDLYQPPPDKSDKPSSDPLVGQTIDYRV
jgi:hypothetical protein